MKEYYQKVGHRSQIRRVFRLPDGRVEDFDIKHECQSVCILPLTKNEQIILAKQFRPGVEEIVCDLPGGGMDAGENAEGAAHRELLEETGYSGRLEFVGINYECGYSTKIRHNFVATDCRRVADQALDENEFIEVVEVSIGQYRDILRSGRSTVIETGYMGLDHLGLL